MDKRLEIVCGSLDDHSDTFLTLGEHLIAGLEDILQGRVTTVSTQQELTEHLDSLFNEEDDRETYK